MLVTPESKNTERRMRMMGKQYVALKEEIREEYK